MRLIDVCGLEEDIRCAMCTNSMKSDRGCDGCCSYNEKVFDEVMKTLNERIAIRPKGKWIGADKDVCSVCNRFFDSMDGSLPNYCPNCGADMRGENNDK